MCDLVNWVKVHWPRISQDETLDIAWSAYFCGRVCILNNGGVPRAGLAHDYPRQIRARIPKYVAVSVLASGAWVVPVHAPVTSGFGPRGGVFHYGTDLGAMRGTPIQAASAGTVITVVCNSGSGTCDTDGSPAISGCGWYVEIAHAANVVTRYCHMLHQPLVQVGQTVVCGQVIGYVGTSGNSSGPHLHFEVHTGRPANNDNAIDPSSFMIAHGAPFPP
jgi:murein DD-endopeptidase MepM/ murein hydrolase activator NlpD